MLLVPADGLPDLLGGGVGGLDGADHAAEAVGAAEEFGEVPHLEAHHLVLNGPAHAPQGVGNAAGHVASVRGTDFRQLRLLPQGVGPVGIPHAVHGRIRGQRLLDAAEGAFLLLRQGADVHLIQGFAIHDGQDFAVPELSELVHVVGPPAPGQRQLEILQTEAGGLGDLFQLVFAELLQYRA